MPDSTPTPAAKMKSVTRLIAEEEARVVVAEAMAAAEERARARDKARRDMEKWSEEAKAAAKAQAEARAAEEARIEATGKDQWYYVHNGQQHGPIPLANCRKKSQT